MSNRFNGRQVNVGQAFFLDTLSQQRAHQEAEAAIAAELHRQELLRQVNAEVELLLSEAHQDAKNILDAATARAGEILNAAHADQARIEAEAFERGQTAGFEKGYADGLSEIQQQTVDWLTCAQTLLNAAYDAERTVLRQFRPDAVALMQYVLTTLLKDTLDEELPRTLAALADAAADSLALSGRVRLVLNGEVLTVLRQASPEVQAALERLSRFEFVADPLIRPDVFYIVGAEGQFDLTPAQQVGRLLAPLKRHLQLPELVIPEPAEVLAEASWGMQPKGPTEPSTISVPLCVDTSPPDLPAGGALAENDNLVEALDWLALPEADEDPTLREARLSDDLTLQAQIPLPEADTAATWQPAVFPILNAEEGGAEPPGTVDSTEGMD
jgi:flagellar biosynthesis/type III secretory pathway protein FliH